MSKSFKAVAEHCHGSAGLYCIVPHSVVLTFRESETFVASVLINGACDLGRRTIKPWGDGRWFIEFNKEQCRRARLRAGEDVLITVATAPTMHDDFVEAIRSEGLDGAWNKLTKAQRRSLNEEIFAARSEATRHRRIVKALDCLRALQR
jgi:hypothetical protein